MSQLTRCPGVRHAWVTTGLFAARGARQYKRLVRRWHPDQYANDPQGQAEASRQIRAINEAFAIIQRAASGVVDDDAPSSAQDATAADTATSPDARSRFFGQRLTDAELDEIVTSMNSPTFAGSLARYLVSGLALGWGLILILQPGRPRTTSNTVTGVILWIAVAVHWAHGVWWRKR